MLSVTAWKWKKPDGSAVFSASHVNTLRSMVDRHLHLPHKFYCITDDPTGLDGDISVVPIEWFNTSVRCRRRMVQYAEWWKNWVGPRFLNLDLDIVLTDDVTPLFDTAEPIKLWKVGYAGVYSGSVQLMDAGVFHYLYQMYARETEDFPKLASPRGVGSDQAMLNYYLNVVLEGYEPAHWTEADGIHTFFGKGYEKQAHRGVSPKTDRLPDGCRIVVLGSEDLSYLKLPCLSAHYR